MTEYDHTKQHDKTVQFINKILIYIFGVLGILLDSNFCYIVSLTVWIWLTPCLSYEWKIIETYNKIIRKK